MEADPIEAAAAAVSVEEQRKQQALVDYRKKLLQLRELEARVKTLRENLKGARKDYDKTEDDLKALQSVGQIIGEVLRQLDEERRESVRADGATNRTALAVIVKASSGYVAGCRSKVDKSKLTAEFVSSPSLPRHPSPRAVIVKAISGPRYVVGSEKPQEFTFYLTPHPHNSSRAVTVKASSGPRVIVKASSGPRYVVGCRSKVDKSKLTAGTRVALDMTTLTIMRALPREVDPLVYNMLHEDPGNVSYSAIGGLGDQIRELRESIELPLMNPELFLRVGIKPPKGVLLYGPPGTGKTLLARAIASNIDANFLKVVSSAIVDKYIGESARLIREMFNYARDHQPCIIFMDEIDAIGGRRFSEGTSADREIQRTLMELLNQLDGFDQLGRVVGGQWEAFLHSVCSLREDGHSHQPAGRAGPGAAAALPLLPVPHTPPITPPCTPVHPPQTLNLHQVKMIMATNRPDVLDPALLRPGRLDRKIEIPLPNEQGRIEVLKIHALGITKHGEIDYEAIVKLAEGFNGADLRNVCTEAGMFAIRDDRDYVVHEDFMKAVRKITDAKKLESSASYSADFGKD
ncbi:unnamed protein product [Closterium sp. NIES-64]|nr:unnamed protein product [Closterium sp. NIES-64]